MENPSNPVASPPTPVTPPATEPSPMQPAVAPRPSNVKIFLLIIVALLFLPFILVMAYVLVKPLMSPLDSEPTAENTSLPATEESPIMCTLDAKICPDGSSVGRTGPNCEFAPCPSDAASAISEDWITISNLSYSFSYPPDFTIREVDGSSVVSKLGPTQKLGTEMYDGVMVQFRAVDLEGQPLADFVEAQIAADKNNGISTVVDAKQPITIKGYTGFSYVVEGMGTFTQNYIQAEGSNQALEVIYLVADPSQQNFQSSVDQILNTIQLT